MKTSRKALIAAGAAALLLGGCATGYDHYDNTYSYYDSTPRYRSYYYDPYYDPYYYGPRTYVAPSIGFGLSYHRGRWR